MQSTSFAFDFSFLHISNTSFTSISCILLFRATFNWTVSLACLTANFDYLFSCGLIAIGSYSLAVHMMQALSEIANLLARGEMSIGDIGAISWIIIGIAADFSGWS